MKLFVLSLAALALLTSSCGRNEVKTASIDREDELKDISQAQWAALARKKIYFGHQSVGNNIVQGVQELLKEYPGIALTVEDTHYPADFDKPLLAQSVIGHNRKPYSKCDEFARMIENGLGERADLVFFKFCYVDIDATTDVDALFRYYTTTMQKLAAKYPRLKIAHCTVPLTASPTGVRNALKRLLHRPIAEDADNIKRDRFNGLLRGKYGGSGLLFDLSDYESTYGNGGQCTFCAADGLTYPALLPAYTDDGCHLNAAGRRALGKRFLLFLQGAV